MSEKNNTSNLWRINVGLCLKPNACDSFETYQLKSGHYFVGLLIKACSHATLNDGIIRCTDNLNQKLIPNVLLKWHLNEDHADRDITCTVLYCNFQTVDYLCECIDWHTITCNVYRVYRLSVLRRVTGDDVTEMRLTTSVALLKFSSGQELYNTHLACGTNI